MDNTAGETWAITILFNNSSHQEVSRLVMDPQTISGAKGVRDHVDEQMMARLGEMQWKGFGLWCGHEAVTKETIFDDVNYQRKADGTISFDCEDHNCQYRAIKVPVNRTEECVVCLNKNDGRSTMLCMHMCCCSACFAKIDRCPICRKRKKVQ